jgi:cytochrome c5
MSLKATITIITVAGILAACTSRQEAEQAAKSSPSPVDAAVTQEEIHGTAVEAITLSNPLNAEWVKTGKEIYDLKCLACHKLSDAKVVGPGWAGVTIRRKPEWIINMITNVDMMLASDEEAQKLLEACLVRMPNQNISNEDARKILEFMRSNDGEK